jgi:lipopolysaccharide transport system ATP-binding protein
MSDINTNPLAIKIINLNKDYYLGKHNFLGVQTTIHSNKEIKKIQAIKNINLEINKRDRVGLLGHNGSGKSTLLKIISNITTPTSGEILVNGKICSVLQGRVAFHPELTGLENIYLVGALHGMSSEQIDKKIDNIIEFSELKEFINTPIKRYSDGMSIKLAFSTLSHLDGDILILDEILATVDGFFREKVIKRILRKIDEEYLTLIFVSHQIENIKDLCKKIVILERGEVKFVGGLDDGIKIYNNSLT